MNKVLNIAQRWGLPPPLQEDLDALWYDTVATLNHAPPIEDVEQEDIVEMRPIDTGRRQSSRYSETFDSAPPDGLRSPYYAGTPSPSEHATGTRRWTGRPVECVEEEGMAPDVVPVSPIVWGTDDVRSDKQRSTSERLAPVYLRDADSDFEYGL